MRELPKRVQIYILLIYAIGLTIGLYLISHYPVYFNLDIIIFIIFTIITESLAIYINNQGGVSVGIGIILPIIVFFGPGIAIIAAALGILLAVMDYDGGYKHLFNIPFFKSLFNMFLYVISVGLAALYFVHANNGIGINSLYLSVLYMIIASVIFLCTNTILLGVLLTLISSRPIIEIWKETFRGVFTQLFSIAILSIVICLCYASFQIVAVILLFFPLLLGRYSVKLYLEMKESYLDSIRALTSALEEKDAYTKGHAERVEKYSMILAQEIHNTRINKDQLHYAAIFHDIGKIGIKESILNKPGKLTNEEYEEIKKHPSKGVNILGNVKFLRNATDMIAAHHEFYNGMGYPKGLKGEKIPIESRIISIADTFDALTTDRPYRKGMPKGNAIGIIKDESGKQFDSQLVDVFVNIFNEGRLT